MSLFKFDKSVLTPPTMVGLALPLIGMPVWYLIAGSGLLEGMERLNRVILGSLVTAGLAAGVVLVVVLWEKKPLTELGIQKQTRRTIIFALSASIVIAVAGTLISLGLIKLLGMPTPALLTDRILEFPVWFSVWLVVSSSVAEEVLFRGFAIERLGRLTGSVWWGGLITLVWFTALHLQLGLTYSLVIVLPASTMLTLLYIWRRDLVTTAIVHFVFNAPILAASILFALARK